MVSKEEQWEKQFREGGLGERGCAGEKIKVVVGREEGLEGVCMHKEEENSTKWF